MSISVKLSNAVTVNECTKNPDDEYTHETHRFTWKLILTAGIYLNCSYTDTVKFVMPVFRCIYSPPYFHLCIAISVFFNPVFRLEYVFSMWCIVSCGDPVRRFYSTSISTVRGLSRQALDSWSLMIDLLDIYSCPTTHGDPLSTCL